MGYIRKNSWNNYQQRPTKVQLHWSQKYGAYSLKWQDTHHFKEMTPIMNFLKSKPYGEYTYDPDNKIWYFAEKHLADVRSLLDAFVNANIFEIDFQEKPQGQTFQTKFVSIDTYLDNFKNLTGQDIRGLDYNAAKKIYRHVCMAMHPDRNPNSDARIFSSVNEIWTELEYKHFKVKQEIQNVEVSV